LVLQIGTEIGCVHAVLALHSCVLQAEPEVRQ
jgi:hypothetical protein